MSNKVIPSEGWILVHRPMPGEVTAGGIVVPESVRARASGITPGEASRANCVAVGAGVTCCRAGDSVFLNANNENLVPVVTDEYGQVERQNGFLVPEYYLFKASAVAGVIPATADDGDTTLLTALYRKRAEQRIAVAGEDRRDQVLENVRADIRNDALARGLMDAEADTEVAAFTKEMEK